MINQIKIKNKNIIPIQNCPPKYVQSGCYIFNKNNLEIGIAQNFAIKNNISFYSNSFIIDLRQNAFYWCSSLQSVNLPNVINIDYGAFEHCISLQSINLPNVTNIGVRAFAECFSLQTINLPNAINISAYAFYQCSLLQSVNLPNITNISNNAFAECSSLQSINLPNITNIDNDGFAKCTSLSQIALGISQICTLSTSYVFNSTPFTMSSTSGGILYVPQSLITDYQNATDWMAILAANSNNQILPIEGSPFDPNSQE